MDCHPSVHVQRSDLLWFEDVKYLEVSNAIQQLSSEEKLNDQSIHYANLPTLIWLSKKLQMDVLLRMKALVSTVANYNLHIVCDCGCRHTGRYGWYHGPETEEPILLLPTSINMHKVTWLAVLIVSNKFDRVPESRSERDTQTV